MDTCASGRTQTHNPSKGGPIDPRLRQRSHPDRQQRISLRDFFVILYFISLIFIQSPHPFLRNASIHVSSSLWTVINQDWPTYDKIGRAESWRFEFVCVVSIVRVLTVWRLKFIQMVIKIQFHLTENTFQTIKKRVG